MAAPAGGTAVAQRSVGARWSSLGGRRSARGTPPRGWVCGGRLGQRDASASTSASRRRRPRIGAPGRSGIEVRRRCLRRCWASSPRRVQGPASSVEVTSSRSMSRIWPPMRLRMPLGSSSAITVPSSRTTTRSASRSISSRFWLVRTTAVPRRGDLVDEIPQPSGFGGQGRRWVRRAAAAKVRRSRSRRGRGGGACRPSRCRPGGRRRRPGRGVEQLVGAGADNRLGRGRRGGRRARGSPGRSAARRPRRTGRRGRCGERTPPGRRSARVPQTVTSPSSAASSVAMIRTSVVLPAPFGPRRPTTSPAETSRSTPRSAWTSPNERTTPRTCRIGHRRCCVEHARHCPRSLLS